MSFTDKTHHMDGDLEEFLRKRSMESILNIATGPIQSDSKIKRVEIIVLKYRSLEIEKDCVSRIIEYTQWPYKLNIFDNRGNGPNTAKVWNKLIEESTCDYILFIDSDAFVHGDVRFPGNVGRKVCWVTEMMKGMHMWDNVAWVGPISGNRGVTTIQSMLPKDVDPFTVEGHLSGYCFLIKKSIYKELGLFDVDFCFYGQESDWIEKMFEKGKHKIVVAPRAHVLHGTEHESSLAAKQASEEGEMDVSMDASYSYLTWHFKKQQRMKAKGKEYAFKY